MSCYKQWVDTRWAWLMCTDLLRWPGAESMRAQLEVVLSSVGGLEAKLERLRWHVSRSIASAPGRAMVD